LPLLPPTPPQNRLAYLTNKCSGEADLEYYIMEAGHIMGLRLPEDCTAKHVLAEVRFPPSTVPAVWAPPSAARCMRVCVRVYVSPSTVPGQGRMGPAEDTCLPARACVFHRPQCRVQCGRRLPLGVP
jgi:hypothetical protein